MDNRRSSSILYSIYVLIKPVYQEHLLYTTLAAAQRACVTVGHHIEEWAAIEDRERMIFVGRWWRNEKGEFLFDDRNT